MHPMFAMLFIEADDDLLTEDQDRNRRARAARRARSARVTRATASPDRTRRR